MLTTQVIVPQELTAADRRFFQEMATWRYAKYLDPLEHQSYTFIALFDNQQPKGLCIIDLSPMLRLCEIKHYSLSPETNAFEGVRQMVSHAVEITKEKNFPLITLKYTLTSENEPLDHYLETSGWSKPRPWLKQYLFEIELFRPRWMERTIPIPKDCAVVHSVELTDELKRSIKATVHGAGLPVYLTPYYWEEYRQELNTLFFVKGDRVVGWSVTHTFPDSPDTIQYTSLFMHPLYRFHGCSIRLLVDSIRRHIEASVKYGLFTLSLHDSSKGWKRFIERNLEPNSQQVIWTVRRDYFI